MKNQNKNDHIPSPEELFTEYAPLIFKVASGYLKNPEDCRECVNDTFLEFYKHPERYDPQKGSLAAYLSAIAGKKAISKWRKSRRSGEASASVLRDPSVPGNDAVTEDPAEHIAGRVDLEKALLALNEEELNLIRLRYYNGMSIREIADDMRIPYEAVKKRHQRTLKKLRILLLVITVLAVLAGCVFFLAKKAGVIPGYGEVTEDAGPVYCLEEPVSVPVPGTEWEAWITMAVYQDTCLTIHYHLTDREGRMLPDRETGAFHEILGDNEWDHNHSADCSAESFLYIGPGHYEDFAPDETTYIGNTGPGYFDCWLGAFDNVRLENRENGDCYHINEPIWNHESLPAILQGEEEISFTFASDIVITEKENGTVWKDGAAYDSWSGQLSEKRHRFEAELTLRVVSPENLEDHACDYNEEDGGVLAMPSLQNGHLIVAIYPLQGSHGRIAAGLVSTGAYQGTAEDPETGILTAVSEDGTVLTGTLLGDTQSDAKRYSEWDFGPAEPGTYKLKIPYLLKYYYSEGGSQSISIPFSLKSGKISSRSVTLNGIRITASNLQPLDWEDLLVGSSREAGVYYGVKETPFYSEDDRLWSFEVETEVPNADETVVSLNFGLSHKNAYIFDISGDTETGVFSYDLPEDGKIKYFLVWGDAADRIDERMLDTWVLTLWTHPYDEIFGLFGAGITTRWEHPVELEFTVE